ncbi:MAG: hypothetical protein Q4G58_15930 [bacterium]|nr:hypothetical protein [bacterium]
MSNLKEKMMNSAKKSLVTGAAKASRWGNDGCMLYFYDPKKPEDMKNVDIKEIKSIFSK